jgi:hypothetical protein
MGEGISDRGGKHMSTFELLNLNSTKKPPRIFERMHEALESAEQRGLSRYRIDELQANGARVLRLQIGSTS